MSGGESLKSLSDLGALRAQLEQRTQREPRTIPLFRYEDRGMSINAIYTFLKKHNISYSARMSAEQIAKSGISPDLQKRLSDDNNALVALMEKVEKAAQTEGIKDTDKTSIKDAFDKVVASASALADDVKNKKSTSTPAPSASAIPNPVAPPLSTPSQPDTNAFVEMDGGLAKITQTSIEAMLQSREFGPESLVILLGKWQRSVEHGIPVTTLKKIEAEGTHGISGYKELNKKFLALKKLILMEQGLVSAEAVYKKLDEYRTQSKAVAASIEEYAKTYTAAPKATPTTPKASAAPSQPPTPDQQNTPLDTLSTIKARYHEYQERIRAAQKVNPVAIAGISAYKTYLDASRRIVSLTKEPNLTPEQEQEAQALLSQLDKLTGVISSAIILDDRKPVLKQPSIVTDAERVQLREAFEKRNKAQGEAYEGIRTFWGEYATNKGWFSFEEWKKWGNKMFGGFRPRAPKEALDPFIAATDEITKLQEAALRKHIEDRIAKGVGDADGLKKRAERLKTLHARLYDRNVRYRAKELLKVQKEALRPAQQEALTGWRAKWNSLPPEKRAILLTVGSAAVGAGATVATAGVGALGAFGVRKLFSIAFGATVGAAVATRAGEGVRARGERKMTRAQVALDDLVHRKNKDADDYKKQDTADILGSLMAKGAEVNFLKARTEARANTARVATAAALGAAAGGTMNYGLQSFGGSALAATPETTSAIPSTEARDTVQPHTEWATPETHAQLTDELDKAVYADGKSIEELMRGKEIQSRFSDESAFGPRVGVVPSESNVDAQSPVIPAEPQTTFDSHPKEVPPRIYPDIAGPVVPDKDVVPDTAPDEPAQEIVPDDEHPEAHDEDEPEAEPPQEKKAPEAVPAEPEVHMVALPKGSTAWEESLKEFEDVRNLPKPQQNYALDATFDELEKNASLREKVFPGLKGNDFTKMPTGQPMNMDALHDVIEKHMPGATHEAPKMPQGEAPLNRGFDSGPETIEVRNTNLGDTGVTQIASGGRLSVDDVNPEREAESLASYRSNYAAALDAVTDTVTSPAVASAAIAATAMRERQGDARVPNAEGLSRLSREAIAPETISKEKNAIIKVLDGSDGFFSLFSPGGRAYDSRLKNMTIEAIDAAYNLKEKNPNVWRARATQEKKVDADSLVTWLEHLQKWREIVPRNPKEKLSELKLSDYLDEVAAHAIRTGTHVSR